MSASQYQQLVELREVLPGVPFMALTATATPTVRTEIVQNLGLGGGQEPVTVVTTFDRPNLHYSAMNRSHEAQEATLGGLVGMMQREEHRPAVIYANTKKETEEVAGRVAKMAREARVPRADAKVSPRPLHSRRAV